MIIERSACLLEEPPALPVLEAGDIAKDGDGDCALELSFAAGVCLTSAGAVKIRRALDELAEYARESFTLCGKAKP